INVHEREIILRQDQQSLTIQCCDILSIKKFKQINKIYFIDAGGRDFDSEEIENFLNDDSIPLGVADSSFNMEEDILFLESLLIEDLSPPYPIILNQTKSLIEEPKHSFNMGYQHFNTNLVTNDVAESSTKNLVPIPRESKVISENVSESIEPVKDKSLVFTTISKPLLDNDKINSDEINSQVESNFDESTSNLDTVKFDNLDEFFGPLIPIHIIEEERIRREHADYINRMEMLFIINPRPHPSTYANTNVESFSSFPILIQESESHQEEINVVTITNDVLPLNFVILDFITDPRVPLILGRPFLSTAHAIINVHEREIILRQDQQSLTIQCCDILSIKKFKQINKIYFIDAGGRDFDSEEIENFLNDDSIPLGVADSSFNMEEDILFLESLLIEDLSPPYPIILNQTKSLIEEPKHSFNMGYQHFNTNLVTNDVAESSTKNLVPIPRESKVISENVSESIEPVKDKSLVFTTISKPLLDNDKINSDEINSQVESNFDESTSNLDTESESHQEEINVVTITNDVLPLSVENDDSNGEVDAVDDLRVDNFIQNSKHEFFESEDSDFDNPSIPLPPLEPPDEEFDFESVFLVVRNTIVKFECIDARVKFDVFSDENDVLSYFISVIFDKVFSFLFVESEDTIFDPGLFPSD
nr:hypothetical protein [Tanacetum cinerariifolium]